MSFKTLWRVLLPLLGVWLLSATAANAMFLSSDPIGTKDDPNLYMYVGLDPVNNTDPTGKCFTPQCVMMVARAARDFVSGAGQGARDSVDPYALNLPDSAAGRTGYVVGHVGAGMTAVLAEGVGSASVTRRVTGSAASGLGDLTRREARQIQSVTDQAERPLEVVGSAARGERRGVGSGLPVGKGPGTQSDIDYTTAGANRQSFDGLEGRLPSADPQTPILRGGADPAQGPSIRFEPGTRPRCVPASSC